MTVFAVSLVAGETGVKLTAFIACGLLAVVCAAVALRLQRGGGRGAPGLQMRRLRTSRLAMEERLLLSTRGELDLARLQLLLTDRDFNGDDYEVLAALDEEDGAAAFLQGLSHQEINRLPLHTVSATEAEGKGKAGKSTCSICLENYVAGERVRTLPCLHQFHAQCCDPWLERQASCPVCKFSAET